VKGINRRVNNSVFQIDFLIACFKRIHGSLQDLSAPAITESRTAK
jgi:hypothetical protein